jgi:uncharacterized protein YkwD
MSTRAYTTRTSLSLLLAIASVGFMSLPATPAGGATHVVIARRGGGWSFNYIEKCMMKKINKARARSGLRQLRPDRQIGYIARRHAESMASSRAVYHDSNLGSEVTNWRALGQNSGAAGGCRRLFHAFMRSAPHRSNILGHWHFIGLGVQWGGGRLYAQQVFENKRDPGNVYHYP